MKRIRNGFMAAILITTVMSGCSGKKEESTYLKDIDVDQYVTLGEYKGIEVTVAPITVDPDEVEALTQEAYMAAVSEDVGGIKDRAVEDGDTAIIDYEGKQDGVPFDGGTADGASLTIGSHNFIDGFEEGLIGVMPGETIDLNLNFPEDYWNPDMAGAEVVFTVTVRYILPTEMTEDAVVSALEIEGVNTIDELRQYAYDYLNQMQESTYGNSIEGEVMEAFMNQCEFKELPQKMLEEYQDIIKENMALEAESYSSYIGSSVDAETYAQQVYGSESLDAYAQEYAEETVRQGLAMQAVANREGLNIDDEMLDTRILAMAVEYGYGTVEEFIGEASKEDFREYFMSSDVLDFLVDNAVVIESEE